MSNDVTISCDNVSKRFARDLKKSLFYGLCDTFSELKKGGVKDENPPLRDSEFWALKNVSFELKRGEAMALMGANGCGKTTMLKVLNGLLKPDTGRVTMRGRVGALISLGAGFNPILTGRENIYVNGSVLGFSKRDIDARFDEIVDFAGISESIDAPVRTYSSGMQVRLGFSVATCMDPRILLIDEVLAVGDFSFRARCYGRLASLMEDTTILFVSHSAQQVTRICNKGILLESGEPVMCDDVAKVIMEYNRRNAPNSAFRVLYDGDASLTATEVPNREINFGGDLTLNLGIESKTRYENCFLRILIRKADEELVGEWNSELHDHLFDIPVGESSHEFTVNNLRLHDGIYRIAFFVMAEDRITHLINATNVETIESTGLCYGGVAVQF
ncbi:MAG: ABC transporter ATP-binding protein [Verrucomicrobiales bacterium]|nr:ABC transporter ATP-binding protein [Verrucomicrobiales bacterium]